MYSDLSQGFQWNCILGSLNPTLVWICTLTVHHRRRYRNRTPVLILLWSGYVLWPAKIRCQHWPSSCVLILLWSGYVLWPVKHTGRIIIGTGLNPTLVWICTLTLESDSGKPRTSGLNPTLVWICTLTPGNPWTTSRWKATVLILLWSGYVLWRRSNRRKGKY